MSINSSNSRGNIEISTSLLLVSAVDLPDSQITTSDQCSSTLPQTVNYLSDGNDTQKTTIPTQAESIYVWLLNQTRCHEYLIPDPTGPRNLIDSTPTKWAVLSVLSTGCYLSVATIQVLLSRLSYRCSKYSIRRALKRCAKFGLVEPIVGQYEGQLLHYRKTRKHTKWTMTLRGRSLINAPNKIMKKEKIVDKIQTELTKSTKWMSVSDIAVVVSCNAATIRKNLRRYENHSTRPGIFKSSKIPGDHHGRYQWAMSSIDTTGWDDAAPIKARVKLNLRKSKKVTTPSGTVTGRLSMKTPVINSPPRSNQPAIYQGVTLMCAPVNKPSLIKAVGDLLVEEFITSGTKFSAYDVTKKLREKVLERAKELDSPFCSKAQFVASQETGTVHVQGLEVPKIEHEDVKAIVHDIFNAGGMPDLGRLHIKTASSNYWEYDTKANIDAYIAANPQQFTKVVDPDPATGITGSTVSALVTSDPDTSSDRTNSSYDGSSTI